MKKSKLLNVVVILGLVNGALGAAGKPTVAVFDFGLSPTVTGEIIIETGGASRVVTISAELQTSLLTDKFVTALTKSEKVSVVERKKLASLRDETSLSQAGLTDPNKSVEFGKLLGADYFLYGSLSMLDGKMGYEVLHSGEIIGQTETRLAIVKVTQGLGKLSKAELVNWVTEDKTIPEGSLCRLFLPDAGGGPAPTPQGDTPQQR